MIQPTTDRKSLRYSKTASFLNGSFISVAATLVLFCLINIRWIWLFRYGQPLDIDESGYLSYAFVDYSNLVHGGIVAWLRAVEAPSIQAPLTTALTSLLLWVIGPHIIVGFLVPLTAGAACIVATFYLGSALGSPAIGVLASILIASCPVIINYSRTYQFSMPATFIAALALLALVRSDRFIRIGWALVYGLCLGLLPLTRTMTVAFLPGLVAGALVYTLAVPDRRFYRLVVLAGAVTIGLIVVAVWLVPNFIYVSQYLVNYGYGTNSKEYGFVNGVSVLTSGARQSILSAWIATMLALINGDIYILDFIFLCVGLLAALLYGFQLFHRCGWKSWLSIALRSKLLPIGIFILEAILALNSTSNKGSAFFAPLMPALFVMAVFFIYQIFQNDKSKKVVAVLMTGFAITVGIPFLNLTSSWAIPTSTILFCHRVTVTDGRGNIEREEAAGGFGPSNAAEPIDSSTGRNWMAASAATGKSIVHLVGKKAVVAFGFRNELYNVNTVNLELILTSGTAFAMSQIDPMLTGDSVTAYQKWLTGDNANACILLTSDRIVAGDFKPPVVRSDMIQAAKQAGFLPRQSWSLPDSEEITLWTPINLPTECRKAGGLQ